MRTSTVSHPSFPRAASPRRIWHQGPDPAILLWKTSNAVHWDRRRSRRRRCRCNVLLPTRAMCWRHQDRSWPRARPHWDSWRRRASACSSGVMTHRQNPVTTHVFLRIEHDTTEPEVLTAALGITPTFCGKRGQLLAGGKGESYPWNVWVLSSAYAVVSKDARAHFHWLLASVGSRGGVCDKILHKLQAASVFRVVV